MSENFEQKIHDIVQTGGTKNMGALESPDAVGTAGSPGCGDMLRMWMKFREDKQGKKVIDKATFQSFGCETAIAVASVATEMLAGKTIDEAKQMTGETLAAPLGPLPPMKIHCASLVEEALRQALESAEPPKPGACEELSPPDQKGTLMGSMTEASGSGTIVFKPKDEKTGPAKPTP